MPRYGVTLLVSAWQSQILNPQPVLFLMPFTSLDNWELAEGFWSTVIEIRNWKDLENKNLSITWKQMFSKFTVQEVKCLKGFIL